jgi:hypothetical protein
MDLLLLLALAIVVAGACYGTYLYFSRKGAGRG